MTPGQKLYIAAWESLSAVQQQTWEHKANRPLSPAQRIVNALPVPPGTTYKSLAKAIGTTPGLAYAACRYLREAKGYQIDITREPTVKQRILWALNGQTRALHEINSALPDVPNVMIRSRLAEMCRWRSVQRVSRGVYKAL